MNHKARQTIGKHDMLAQGDYLSVGLSGGADSVALVHFLLSIQEEYSLKLAALHLNHCLRGDESLRDENFVRELCGRWGIPLTVERADVEALSGETGDSVELQARRERYDFFHRHTPPGGKIATAHTLSDSAETALLNLTRGTGIRGLCGIPPVRENIVRPLIAVTREEVLAYCKANGLDWVEDSTNASDRFTRNKLRSKVLPVLMDVNPSFLTAFEKSSELFRQDADYLDSLAEQAMERAIRSPHDADGNVLRELPPPVRSRVFRNLLKLHGVSVEKQHIDALQRVLCDGKAVRLSGEWYCRLQKGDLHFYPATGWAFEPVRVDLNLWKEDLILPVFLGKTLRLFVADYEFYKESINSQSKHLKNVLDYDRMNRLVNIRQRQPGDQIRLQGRGCTKSLRKLFGESGLDPWQRERILLLESGGEILWLEGYGASEEAAPDEATRRVLVLELSEG